MNNNNNDDIEMQDVAAASPDPYAANRIKYENHVPYIVNGELYTIVTRVGASVKVRCNSCPGERLFSGSVRSTGNFHNHLKRCHPNMLEKLRELKAQSLEERRLRNALNKKPPKRKIKREIKIEPTMFATTDMQPTVSHGQEAAGTVNAGAERVPALKKETPIDGPIDLTVIKTNRGPTPPVVQNEPTEPNEPNAPVFEEIPENTTRVFILLLNQIFQLLSDFFNLYRSNTFKHQKQ